MKRNVALVQSLPTGQTTSAGQCTEQTLSQSASKRAPTRIVVRKDGLYRKVKNALQLSLVPPLKTQNAPSKRTTLGNLLKNVPFMNVQKRCRHVKLPVV